MSLENELPPPIQKATRVWESIPVTAPDLSCPRVNVDGNAAMPPDFVNTVLSLKEPPLAPNVTDP